MAVMQCVRVIFRLQILGIVLGTLLYLRARQRHAERSLTPTHGANPLRSNQNLFARQPIARFDNEMADGPRLFLEEKIGDVTYHSIGGSNVITQYYVATP